MEPNEIRDIEDWDARSRAASKALTAALKAEVTDVSQALDLIDILAKLALDFAGDDQSARASRIRGRCDRTLRDLAQRAPTELAERIALMRLRVTRTTRGLLQLTEAVETVQRTDLTGWSAPGLALLDAIEAHCQWERRARDDARLRMVDATTRLEPHYRADPNTWLPDYAWACGRLAYWFDMAELRDEELIWRRRAVDALNHQLEFTRSVGGLLGIHQEKLGRLLMKRGELDEAGPVLEAALVNVAHWADASKDVRSALKKLRKLKARAESNG